MYQMWQWGGRCHAQTARFVGRKQERKRKGAWSHCPVQGGQGPITQRPPLQHHLLHGHSLPPGPIWEADFNTWAFGPFEAQSLTPLISFPTFLLPARSPNISSQSTKHRMFAFYFMIPVDKRKTCCLRLWGFIS